ncbi:terminase small subunit [Paenibacillus chitinolyticus]
MASAAEKKVKKKTNNAVGRPLKFQSVGELEVRIMEYFNSCYEEEWIEMLVDDETVWRPRLDRFGIPMRKQVRPFTISGLAVYLGTTRQTLLNYEEKDEFFDTIKYAKAKIENYTEEQLFNSQAKNMTGIIFNLKNNYDQWSDKQEVDMNAQHEYTILPPPPPSGG